MAGQFLAESLLLSALGGVAGVGLGVLVLPLCSADQHGSDQVVPAVAVWSGLAVALALGLALPLVPGPACGPVDADRRPAIDDVTGSMIPVEKGRHVVRY